MDREGALEIMAERLHELAERFESTEFGEAWSDLPDPAKMAYRSCVEDLLGYEELIPIIRSGTEVLRTRLGT
jgi:hypothetical protein